MTAGPVTAAGPQPAEVSSPARRGRRPLPEHWPLTAALAGFPVWWLLGLAGFAPILLAIPMLLQLLRKRRVLLPPGWAIWALFLVWVVVGVLVLGVDAPSAVTGGSLFSRLLVFGYRLSWYLACTIFLVWLGNSDPKNVSFRRVTQLFGFMFVVTTAGGLLGLFAPELEISSLLETVLPRSLRSNSFIRSLVHLEAADIQTVLGRPEARPKAPFSFANGWGSNFALLLPFFLLGWTRYGQRWQRAAVPLVLALAAAPVVYSLNRGLWLSLVVGAVAVMALALRKGRPALILTTGVALAAVAVGVAVSPLGSMLQERMDNQHSNDRRGQLLSETVRSATIGSPVVGFGSTRDVQGAFSSIAGGSTPDCKACGVPALGTQGQLWGVIFAQGLVGAALFVLFWLRAVGISWRCRTDAEILASVVLLFLFLQLPVYDIINLPLYTVMAAIGLAWREQRLAAPAGPGNTTARWASQTVRKAAPVLVVLVLAGAATGVAWAANKPVQYSARASLLLEPSPVYLAADALQTKKPRPTTVDTEAALALADRSLRRVAASLGSGVEPRDLRGRTTVTASPNTRVLHLDVRAGDPDTARREVEALARAYLAVRERYLSQRKTQMLELLAQKRAELDSTAALPGGSTVSAVSSSGADARRRSRQAIVQAANAVLLSPTSAGEVVRHTTPVPVSRQLEVGAASGAALAMAAGAAVIAFPLVAWPAAPLHPRRRKPPRRHRTR